MAEPFVPTRRPISGLIDKSPKIANLGAVKKSQAQAALAPILSAITNIASPAASLAAYAPESDAAIVNASKSGSMKLKAYAEELLYGAKRGTPIINEQVFNDTGGWIDPATGILKIPDTTLMDAVKYSMFPSQSAQVSRAASGKGSSYNLVDEILGAQSPALAGAVRGKYPELAKTKWDAPTLDDIFSNTLGVYNAKTKQIRSVRNKEVLSHELTHNMQFDQGDPNTSTLQTLMESVNDYRKTGDKASYKKYLNNPMERESRASERIQKQYTEHDAYTLPAYASSKGQSFTKDQQVMGPFEKDTQAILDALEIGSQRYLKATKTDNWDDLMSPLTPR